MASGLRILLIEGDLLRAGGCEIAIERALPDASVTTAATGASGVEWATTGDYDVVVVGADLSDAHGLDVLRELKRTRPTRSVLQIVAGGSEQIAAAALKAGADDFLAEDEVAESLAGRIAAAYGQALRERRRTAMVELGERLDSEADLAKIVEAAATSVALALEAHAASVWLLSDAPPGHAWLGPPLGVAAESVTALFPATPEPGEVSVARPDPADIGIDEFAGSLAVWARGIGGEELTMLLARSGRGWDVADERWLKLAAQAVLAPAGRALARERTRRGVGNDPVTGLAGRPAFFEALEAEAERCRRHGGSLAVVRIVLDDFTALAERAGEGGDALLQETAAAITAQLRRYDTAARTGPGEFSLLLPGSDAGAAQLVAERIREAMHAIEFPAVGRMTVSAGVAAHPDCVRTIDDLAEVAEEALTVARRSGRDHVVVAPRRRTSEPPAGRW